MHSAVSHRWYDRLTLGLVVILVAAAITVLEVGHPSLQLLQIRTQALAAQVPHATASTPKTATKPATITSKTTAAVTTAAPAVAPNTAATTTFVHVRASKSTSSAIITDLNAGTVVQLGDDADATWQGVTYQGKSGYIYRAYLQYQPATTAP